MRGPAAAFGQIKASAGDGSRIDAGAFIAAAAYTALVRGSSIEVCAITASSKSDGSGHGEDGALHQGLQVWGWCTILAIKPKHQPNPLRPQRRFH